MAEKLTTALLLHRTRAAWTSLRDKKGAVEVAEQVDAPVEIPPDAEIAGPQMTAQIKAKCSGVKGIITLVLPTNAALMRVVELPSADPEEIRGMAELQVDKFCPFPVDQMCIGHEVLSQTDGKSRVLVAAAQRGTVDAMGGAFFQAGIMPQSVDVEIMGWWWLLKSKGKIADSGRQVLLVIEEDGTDLVIVQDGSPLLIRSLGAVSSDPATAARELAEEINYTLTTLETEWGSGHADSVEIWHGTAVTGDFLRELSAACGIQVSSNPLNTLLPLSEGLARRIHEHRGATLDLAPAEWKASAISREARQRITIIACTLVAVWLMAIGGLFTYSQHEQSSQVFFTNEIRRLDKKADEVRNLQKQVQSLQRYADRSYSALECLREVCALMPPGPELSAFNYDKYNQVSLRGFAENDESSIQFAAELQKSKFFPKVEPGAMTAAPPRNGHPQSQFRIVITLPPDPAEEKKRK